MRNSPKEIERFLEEVDKHIINIGIISFVWESYDGPKYSKWDIKRVDGKLMFGTNLEQSIYFPLFFSKALFEGKRMGVILRSFREEKDEVTGLPIKEIRGYFIWIDDKNRISFIQLSARDVAISNLTDSETGKPLPPEHSVIYCGPDNDYLDENLNPINI